MWAAALSCATKKISRTERSWTNPLNALQEVIHYSFIKFCIYCFSLWHEFFVHYALRVEGDYQHCLDAGPWEFQFLRPRGCLTNPFRTLSLCFGVIGKTPGVISLNNFVKNFYLSASAIVIISWQDVTQCSLCSGVKCVEQNVCIAFSFPNPLSTTVLGMFKDSINFDAIRRSFLTKSTTTAMFTSVRVDFGRPPHSSSSSTSSLPSRNRECHLKTFDRFRASSP